MQTQRVEEKWTTEDKTVHFGYNAGRNFQGANGVALGASAGMNNQGSQAVAIGSGAGANQQSSNAVAIGTSAGANQQSINAVAIGIGAGTNSQGINAVAIGLNAGNISQSDTAISIGQMAGSVSQSIMAVAIGANAGSNSQQLGSVAIGVNAGQHSQGTNSIAIGRNAGQTNQASNSIILNASTSSLGANSNGLFVSSIRGPRSSSNVLSYDTITNEVYYNGSSERYKYDIKPLSTDTSVIYKLQPREFKYKMTDEADIGLIAEEAFQCDPAFAYLDKDQIPEGIQWNAITTYLIAEIKTKIRNNPFRKYNTFNTFRKSVAKWVAFIKYNTFSKSVVYERIWSMSHCFVRSCII